MRIIRFFLVIVMCALVTGVILAIGSDNAGLWIGWSQIVSITFILSVISFIIREYKPAYTRYPVLFAYMPLLLIPTFILIDDSEVVKDLLNMFLQGGALLVAFILSLTITDKLKRFCQFPGSVFMFAISFVLFWFLDETIPGSDILWPISFSIAVGLAGYSVPMVLNDIEEKADVKSGNR